MCVCAHFLQYPFFLSCSISLFFSLHFLFFSFTHHHTFLTFTTFYFYIISSENTRYTIISFHHYHQCFLDMFSMFTRYIGWVSAVFVVWCDDVLFYCSRVEYWREGESVLLMYLSFTPLSLYFSTCIILFWEEVCENRIKYQKEENKNVPENQFEIKALSIFFSSFLFFLSLSFFCHSVRILL